MTYILGVDGGNSKTLAVIGDHSGMLVGIGRAGPGNHQAKGVQAAMTEIRRAVESALIMAGLRPADITLAYYALAGADLPEDFELLHSALQSALPIPLQLNNDTIAGLRAGTDNPNAVVVALGAGTNAAGRNAAGREIRLPGLGWISGDWGGGGDIAREAVFLSVRSYDGRGHATILQELVPQALGVPDIESMIRMLYHSHMEQSGGIDRATFLDLARLVFKAAHQGDAVAFDLVRRCADEVVTTALALLRRLDLVDQPADVVLAGSIFKAEGSLLVDLVRAQLQELMPTVRVMRPDVESAVGALFCGMDSLGIIVDEDVRYRAAESYRALERQALNPTQEALQP
jgi:N-acetylglucosamine kinase-like BadF-type ATPase